MCGRFTLQTKLNLLLDQFAAEAAGLDDWQPGYNIAPTQNVLAVRLNEGKRELATPLGPDPVVGQGRQDGPE